MVGCSFIFFLRYFLSLNSFNYTTKKKKTRTGCFGCRSSRMMFWTQWLMTGSELSGLCITDFFLFFQEWFSKQVSLSYSLYLEMFIKCGFYCILWRHLGYWVAFFSMDFDSTYGGVGHLFGFWSLVFVYLFFDFDMNGYG